MAGQAGFFDFQDRYAELSKNGDPLEHLLSVMDFEVLRPTLDAALGRKDRSRGGCPPQGAVMVFKILAFQALYGLSDEQAEYQVREQLSFMRSPGLGLGGRFPDRTTICLFRDQKQRMALFIRTIGLGGATVKVGIANLAYNFRRLMCSAKTTAYFHRFAQNWGCYPENYRNFDGQTPFHRLNQSENRFFEVFSSCGIGKASVAPSGEPAG